jgi:flagellar hook-length control protein FliK
MIERGIGTATLRLSPEHLGPVEVRIDLTDDSANVWFTATHADTRAALTDALPRLREMLASVGVNLGDASVHRELPGEPERRDGSWPGGPAAVPESEAESRVVVTRLDAGRGLVDEYA